MSAYATRQREQSARLLQVETVRPRAGQAAGAAAMLRDRAAGSSWASGPGGDDASMIDLLIDRLVDRLAAASLRASATAAPIRETSGLTPLRRRRI
jgi:hypothetical protein